MNKKPLLEESLLKSSKKDLMFKSFLGIGLFSVLTASGSMINNPWLSSLTLTTLPYIFFSFIKKRKIEKNLYTPFDNVSNHFYKKSFEEQFKKYLLESDSLTEQKYKLLMISLWLRHKLIPINDIHPKGLEFIGEIAMNILKEKESQYDLYYLFNAPSFSQDMSEADKKRTQFDTYDLIKEDQDNDEKISIAQDVYQEYSELGMLGKEFKSVGFNKFSTLVALQGYNLTAQDIKEIQKLLKIKKKDKEEHIRIDIKNSHEMIPNIISAQSNIEQLDILKQFIEMLSHETIQKAYHYESYIPFIEKKINTIKFQEKLEESLPEDNVTTISQKKI